MTTPPPHARLRQSLRQEEEEPEPEPEPAPAPPPVSAPPAPCLILPAHDAVIGHTSALALMTGFGEEYELLFTAAPEGRAEIEAICAVFGRHPTAIGQITDSEKGHPVLVGQAWPPLQFTHFREDA